MGYTWTEIKKWAEGHGCVVKKKPKENFYTWEDKEYNDLETLVNDVFNYKTDNKFKEHQENYEKKQKG
jgi:hypothetical protein